MNLNINSGLPAGGGLYREYRFYPSHEVNVEIQCGINRLELPSSMLSSITEDDAEELFVTAFITAYQRSFPLHSSPGLFDLLYSPMFRFKLFNSFFIIAMLCNGKFARILLR